MAEINLFPHKAFEITLNDKRVIKGQYSLWSVKRYTDKKRLSLSQLSQQLTEENLCFDDICQLLLCAIEYTCRKEKKPFDHTDMDVCEWIEEMGGLGSEKYQSLLNHAREEAEPEGTEEKKSPLNGATSKGYVIQ